MSRARAYIKLCLILLIVQSVSCQWKPNNKVKETLCKTPECKARGDEYKKNLNAQKTHPCRDFYSFVCGNWHSNHPGPKYTPTWSMVNVINFNFLSIIRKTLETYKFEPGDNPLFRQAKIVYDACVTIPEYPIKDAADIAREVKTIGRVPKTSLWNIHSKYLKLTGESALFRYKILAFKQWEDRPVLMLMEPLSAYGSIFHGEIWKPQEKHAYTEFLFLITKSLKLKEPDTQIRQRVEKVFEFRKKLDKIIERNKKKKSEHFNPYTGQELDKWFSDTLHTPTHTHYIPWTEVIEALLQHVPAPLRQSQKIIAMRQKEYFLDLTNLLKDVPEDVLAAHMEINFVETHLRLKEDKYKLLEATTADTRGVHQYIREKYYPNWHTCIENHNMKEDLEKLLYHKWFPKEYNRTIHELSSTIRVAIKNQMQKSTWLDKATREKTSQRLDQIVEWVGFPPWIDAVGRPSIDTVMAMQTRSKKEILTPQASLEISANWLYIHAPLLLPPAFSPTIPDIYNYAGIGSTIGHELYHVVDDCGSYELGDEDVVWWPPAMREKCLAKKLLFIKVYNAITDREFKNRYDTNVKSDTTASVLENYPDVMGLAASYNAYKDKASKDKSVCQTLPNFDKYSCDQMFYISFANNFCGFNSKVSVKDKLQAWDHSIDSVRINGAVAQMANFGEAFGCPIGSPMNPQEKLDLWN